MANSETVDEKQVEKEKKLVQKMISAGNLQKALAKAKELAGKHVYSKKEFLDDAKEYGAESESLKNLLKPAWFIGSKLAKPKKSKLIKKKKIKKKNRKK